MAGADQRVSELTITTIYTGGYFHMTIPNGGGGWTSYKFSAEYLLSLALTRDIYDPQNIEQDVYVSLYQIYDNLVSGLTATDIQNAIDEIVAEIDTLPTIKESREGISIITTGSTSPQKITFNSAFVDADYVYWMNAYDNDGAVVFPLRGLKEDDGFSVITEVPCTIEYGATKI